MHRSKLTVPAPEPTPRVVLAVFGEIVKFPILLISLACARCKVSVVMVILPEPVVLMPLAITPEMPYSPAPPVPAVPVIYRLPD